MAPIDEREIEFLLFRWLNADRMIGHEDPDGVDRTAIDAFLSLSASLASGPFLEALKEGDRNEPYISSMGRVVVAPSVRDAVRAYLELGVAAATFPTASGGMGIPFVYGCASMAQFMAANIAASAFPMLSAANARLIDTFGTEAQREAFANPQMNGDVLGTMCLSETEAGSSLRDIRTKAIADGEDNLGERYRLYGAKMWISGADHDITDDIVHLVLAKIPDEEGRLVPGSRSIRCSSPRAGSLVPRRASHSGTTFR